LWLPVLFGLGVIVYMLDQVEPPLSLSLLPLASAVVLRLVWRGSIAGQLLTGVLIAVAAGFAAAKVRSEIVASPVIDRSLSRIALAGFVELVEPRLDKSQRLTIRVVELGDLPPDRRPGRVRVRTAVPTDNLSPGDFVRLTVNVSPPAGPALPGGYDFARAAWFQGLGAVGYSAQAATVQPPPRAAPWDLAARAAIERVRQSIGARVMAALPGETGAIANALITGQRSGISDATNDAFRDSGLLHILSISGLHMVIMAGAVFFSIRLMLAAIPAIALRYPIKKWSAVAATLGALGYLMISGAEFATVRSWIMISIMFVAVLLDRPAIAMRNVALAALGLLVLYPEGLFNVGFQMSFAAVVSLVSAYELIRAREEDAAAGERGATGRVALFFLGIVLSTLLASLSVAPFAAYLFHKSQQYAILANLIAIPICNAIVMPAALATLILMPLGLEAWPLLVMGKGIEAMTWCAQTVASLPGAVGHIRAIPTIAFAFMVTGGIWLVLWRRRWRLLGLIPIAAGLMLSPFEPRPDILVGHDGNAVAFRLADGRLAAPALRSGQFEVTRWLEHDGDARPATGIVSPEIVSCDQEGCLGHIKGRLLTMPITLSALRDDCLRADIIILRLPAIRPCEPGPRSRALQTSNRSDPIEDGKAVSPNGQTAGSERAYPTEPTKRTVHPLHARKPLIITARDVRRLGTHALFLSADGISLTTVADTRGRRPWTRAGAPDGFAQPPLRRSGGGRPSKGPRPSIERAPSSPSADVEDDDHR
jgi:competence protein ComEC